MNTHNQSDNFSNTALHNNQINKLPLLMCDRIKTSDFKDKKKRTILIGDSENRRKYNKFPNNKIRSTKYNIFSWLPKSLIMQFKRVANIYFLIVAILNFFYFSPKNPISMVITFGIILMFTSIREGVEDYQRYKKDRKANEKEYVYYNDKNKNLMKEFDCKASKKIRVGEIIKIFRDEEFPADICILKSSNRSGICFIDTVNLDGESNLKDKKCNRNTQCLSDIQLCNLSAVLKCDNPNEQLDYWEGYMTLFGEDDLKISLDNDQLLLKGSYLKNTDYIIGVVVYTGHETKIMQNAKVPKCKVSKLMKTLNHILYSVMIVQLLLVFLFAYLSFKWQKTHIGEYSYIKIIESNDYYAYMARVGTFLISYSQLIPISMYIGVEMIRLFQSPLIKNDHNIFDSVSNKPSLARTSELPDELGQVNYILSDKTGTLTKNNMILENISIEDQIYSKKELFEFFETKYKIDLNLTNYSNSQNSPNSNSPRSGSDSVSSSMNEPVQETVKLINEEYDHQNISVLKEKLDDKGLTKSQSLIDHENKIIDFFRLVCICNSIVIDYNHKNKIYYSENKNCNPGNPSNPSNPSNPGNPNNPSNTCNEYYNNLPNYQSTSIDELALLQSSINCGIILKDKSINKIEINFLNKIIETWEILAILPFDSERKRMTVIVKSGEGDGNINLFCKGADEVVFGKITEQHSSDIEESNKINKFKYKELNDKFARQGYRTLIMGKKSLTLDTFQKWFECYNEILNDMNLNHYEKYKRLNEVFEVIEEEMDYVGCSAIEDKLQDEVEETIKLLKSAEIKIWMLTGDKVENSLEIAKSCNLISNEKCIYFTLRNIQDFEEFKSNIDLVSASILPQGALDNETYCLVLDGKTLSYYEMLDKTQKTQFLQIILNTKTAICCRLTPKQKSQIVGILKKVANKVVMTVGDGANDVPMIMEANIGVGISGREGTQAVRSADYSISQFKFLKDLLLTHGRLAYKRLCNFTCYAFYKNIIVVFTEIYFILFNGFSGQIFFSDWFTNFYNTFWSSWPCLINFALDRDLDRDIAIKYPFLYTAGHSGRFMNKKIFWTWIAFALFHGAILFWIPVLSDHLSTEANGKTKDHWWTSSLSFSILINIVLIKLFIATDYWNSLSIFGAVSCLACYYLCLYIFSIGSVATSMETKIPHFFFDFFTNVKCLIFLVCLPFIALLPDLSLKFLQKNYFLQPEDIIKKIEAERSPTIDKQSQLEVE